MIEGNNFYVQAFYKGGMNSFEIIPVTDHYNVAYDGEIIGEISYDTNTWRYLGGEDLSKEILQSIAQQIDERKS